MASGPCLRRCRVVRKYMPTNIRAHPQVVNHSFTNHVSMYFEPFQPAGLVNTADAPSGGAYAPQTQAIQLKVPGATATTGLATFPEAAQPCAARGNFPIGPHPLND